MLLIVDDSKWTKEELSHAVDWASLGIEIPDTCTSANAPKAFAKKIVNLAQNYVDQHLLEKSLNLKQTAVDLHINYYYLSKCFKEGAGVTFTQYVNDSRLKIAANLLSTTTLHIYEICRQIGLEPKNFYGLFRKKYNMTPQEYRRQNKQL